MSFYNVRYDLFSNVKSLRYPRNIGLFMFLTLHNINSTYVLKISPVSMAGVIDLTVTASMYKG